MQFERIADIKRLHFIVDVLKDKIPANGNVLDVGCGNGIISKGVGEHGFNVYGIDISAKAIEKARSENLLANVKFDIKSAEALIAEGKKYDAVICSEVLEHLSFPGSLLNVIHQSLKDHGILIVTVPNGNGPREVFVTKPVIALQKKDNWVWRALKKLKSLFGYKGTTVQSDADNLTHIQFFTKKSLQQLATRNQFKIVRFGKTNFIDDVFPFSLVTKRFRLLQKMDCAVAELLPYSFTGGFVTVWEKQESSTKVPEQK
jgi:2-polyprenyl-3-methyl-5-hydroxy-6-metoxy-1,4-benzoquinol methylase